MAQYTNMKAKMDTELENVHWDIICFSEVRRKGIELATLHNGHLYYHVGNDNSQAGVGLLVHKTLAGNVIEFKGISGRICVVSVRLNKKCRVNVIQVYAPTSSYNDDVMEEFFEQVSTTIEIIAKAF